MDENEYRGALSILLADFLTKAESYFSASITGGHELLELIQQLRQLAHNRICDEQENTHNRDGEERFDLGGGDVDEIGD